MERQNKKESVATFHKESILAAAEKLFLNKGVASTTIDDIAGASDYSKRTIYAYYINKDDILYHIILKGLARLKQDLAEALRGDDDSPSGDGLPTSDGMPVSDDLPAGDGLPASDSLPVSDGLPAGDGSISSDDFLARYFAICAAIEKYQTNSPQSAESVNQARTGALDMAALPPVAARIFGIGAEINEMLADFISRGKRRGIVRADVEPMMTVYMMWGGITSLLSLVASKGVFIEKELSVSRAGFLEYGYKQIINSILEERIK